MTLLAQGATLYEGVFAIGAVGAVVGALWLMIQSFVKGSVEREKVMSAAIQEMEKWIRTTMQGMIENNTRAMVTHAAAVESNTKATHELQRTTEELKKEVHSLRVEAKARQKRRDDASDSTLDLGGA